MRKIFTDENLALVWCVRNELENAGISCDLRNDVLGGAAGEIPTTECWPEIWIDEQQDLARAENLVMESMRLRQKPGAGWRCGVCGEDHGGQFSTCWNCGAERGA